jgi:hypothetical protein
MAVMVCCAGFANEPGKGGSSVSHGFRTLAVLVLPWMSRKAHETHRLQGVQGVEDILDAHLFIAFCGDEVLGAVDERVDVPLGGLVASLLGSCLRFLQKCTPTLLSWCQCALSRSRSSPRSTDSPGLSPLASS